MCWSPGNVKVTVQPLMVAVPVLATVTLATNPPAHSSLLAYVTWHGPGFPPVPIVQLNEAEPDALVVSRTVTVTDDVPFAVGVPEINPVLALIASPAGSPVAEYDSVWPAAESVAWICRLAGVPTVPDWLPGLVTVTVLALLVQRGAVCPAGRECV